MTTKIDPTTTINAVNICETELSAGPGCTSLYSDPLPTTKKTTTTEKLALYRLKYLNYSDFFNY